LRGLQIVNTSKDKSNMKVTSLFLLFLVGMMAPRVFVAAEDSCMRKEKEADLHQLLGEKTLEVHSKQQVTDLIEYGLLGGCAPWTYIGCTADYAGVIAGCLAAETGVGAVAAVALAINFYSNCRNCVPAWQWNTICAAIKVINEVVDVGNTIKSICGIH
jgi:hypothetical protein